MSLSHAIEHHILNGKEGIHNHCLKIDPYCGDIQLSSKCGICGQEYTKASEIPVICSAFLLPIFIALHIWIGDMYTRAIIAQIVRFGG